MIDTGKYSPLCIIVSMNIDIDGQFSYFNVLEMRKFSTVWFLRGAGRGGGRGGVANQSTN